MTDDARPRLHFTCRAGWVNDPLGLTWHDGGYHLFFQHVPGSTRWESAQHWGHAVGPDLLHWSEEAVALSPGDGDDGVWSGSLVVPPVGEPALYYTSVTEPGTHLGRARLARPADPGWRAWLKGDVVAEPPSDLDLVAVRDPFVLHDGASWLMLLGAGLADGTATALTYRSQDLQTWAYGGLLAERHTGLTDPWTGEVWECPQLVALGGRWVLVVAVWSEHGPGYEAYAVGDLVDGRFVAERWHRLTYCSSLYAASAFTDADGEPCLIHWVRGARDAAGAWAGAHSLPHRLTLAGDRLAVTPHPAVEAARAPTPSTAHDGSVPVAGPVDIEWTLDGDGPARLVLTGDGAPALVLTAEPGVLTADQGQDTWRMPLAGSRIRVVVDGPLVEVFDGRSLLAVPGAPHPGSGPRAGSLGVSGAGTVTVHRLEA